MIEIDLPIPSSSETFLIDHIDRCLAATGLTITSKGDLAKYPGCVHWHLRHGSAKGTLELTYWPAKPRLWFKIAANRGADWMEQSVKELRKAIENFPG